MLLGVIGGNLSQSLSEELHAYFAKDAGMDIAFSKIEADSDAVKRKIELFFRDGGQGLSVTAPFKELVHGIVDKPVGEAIIVKSVNCVRLNGSKLEGHNTDGLGFVSALTNLHNFELNGKRVLVLGYGGVAAGIVGALKGANVDDIAIWGRNANKAQDFARLHDVNDRLSGSYDLVVHATSSEDYFDLSWLDSHVSENTLIYDVQYLKSGNATWFCKWAMENELSSLSGLSMLVEQGALAFKIWTGHFPSTDIRKFLHERLSHNA